MTAICGCKNYLAELAEDAICGELPRKIGRSCWSVSSWPWSSQSPWPFVCPILLASPYHHSIILAQNTALRRGHPAALGLPNPAAARRLGHLRTRCGPGLHSHRRVYYRHRGQPLRCRRAFPPAARVSTPPFVLCSCVAAAVARPLSLHHAVHRFQVRDREFKEIDGAGARLFDSTAGPFLPPTALKR